MVGSIAASRQTCCRRRSWEFYILILRQQKGTGVHTGKSLDLGALKAHPIVTPFLQQSHMYSNKATPNSATQHRPRNMTLRKPYLFKTPQLPKQNKNQVKLRFILFSSSEGDREDISKQKLHHCDWLAFFFSIKKKKLPNLRTGLSFSIIPV